MFANWDNWSCLLPHVCTIVLYLIFHFQTEGWGTPSIEDVVVFNAKDKNVIHVDENSSNTKEWCFSKGKEK